MLHWLIPVLGAVLLAAGIGLAVFGFIASRRPARSRLCPGPDRGLGRRLASPWNLWLVRACFYDLSGLPAGAEGTVTCPECGRRIGPDETTPKSRRRWRPGRAGATLMLLAVLVVTVPAFVTGQWVHWVPTTALVAVERIDHPDPIRPLRSELERRVLAKSVWHWQARMLVPPLVRDLRDDDTYFNAQRSMWLLRNLGAPAVPALEKALTSDDWQQRQIAADVLRWIDPGPPSDNLLRVTVEGLRSDDLPRQTPRIVNGRRLRPAYTYVANATYGAIYLSRFPDRVGPFLKPGLSSQDSQQRLYCAIVAGYAHCTDLVETAAPILIPHLADNTLSGDAELSAAALYGFGPKVTPLLEPFSHSADKQQRDLVTLILLDLDGPAKTDAERKRRLALNSVTNLVDDPTRMPLEQGLHAMRW